MKDKRTSSLTAFRVLLGLCFLAVIAGIWIIENKLLLTALWISYALLSLLYGKARKAAAKEKKDC